LAFDHQNFATHGLFPGLVSTRSIANLGHFELEIILEPVRGGPGTARTTDLRRPKKDKYKVTIRVRHKTRIWEYERTVSHVTAQVAAKLIGKELPQHPAANVHVFQVTETPETDPTIEVYKK
jgi:hypothetical protein